MTNYPGIREIYISHYKDPYKPISISWFMAAKGFVAVAQAESNSPEVNQNQTLSQTRINTGAVGAAGTSGLSQPVGNRQLDGRKTYVSEFFFFEIRFKVG